MRDYDSFKESIRKIFKSYVSAYDISDKRIALKVEHTYKVADIAEEIAYSISELSKEDVSLCWLIGMLHDIGRFEQMKRFGTFLDSESVDHAELGADIIFKDNLINSFYQESITGKSIIEEKRIIELAIRQHNKYSISSELTEKEKIFCDILRDADKIDIFRVAEEIPFEVRMTKAEDPTDNTPAREEVMNCIRNHTAVPRISNRNSFEIHISGCAMAFEMVYEKSRAITKKQGYLRQMLSYIPPGDKQKEQMIELRREMSYLC